MAAEGVFAGAGSEPGVSCWRIVDFAPVEVPKVCLFPGLLFVWTLTLCYGIATTFFFQEFHGKFYEGDSYIVLFSKPNQRCVSMRCGVRVCLDFVLVTQRGVHRLAVAPWNTASTFGLAETLHRCVAAAYTDTYRHR